MPAQALHSKRDALPQLRHESIPGRITARKEKDKVDRRPLLQELSCKLESDRAASAVAGDHIRTMRSEFADLSREVCGQIRDGCEGLTTIFESGKLQSEERLIISQVLRQSAIQEDVAIVSRHSENGSVVSALLQRHDCALPPCKRRRRTEEFDHVALALPQHVAQVGCQDPGWSVAPQLI